MNQSLDEINGTHPVSAANRMVRDLPDEILIDPELLRASAIRRLRKWAILGPLLFIALMAIQLVFLPQKYEAVTSISVQQAENLMSPLAVLTGSTSSNSKYIGLLQSRQLAGKIEDKYHLQQFYGLATRQKAIDLLINSIRPEDSTAIGLLLVHVSLPGAPRFGPDPHGMRRRVPILVAEVANTYAGALTDWCTNNDNDRDSSLLRAGDAELQEARALYDSAVQDLRSYVHVTGRLPSIEAPTSTNESGAAASAATGMAGFHTQEVETEAEILQLEASRTAEEKGMTKMLGDVRSIPLDDPLLRTAREQANMAEKAYDALVNGQMLAAENPQVVIAKHRMDEAEAELHRQEQAVNKKLTTAEMSVETRIEGLKARLATIRASMAAFEHKMPHRRDLTFNMAAKEHEVEIALARLKEAETKSVELRLTAVSGKSRISVVDTAIPALTGQPGLLRASLISLLVTLAPMILSIIRDYLQTVRRRAGMAMQFATVPALPPQAPVPDGMHNGSNTSVTLAQPRDEASPQ